MKKKARAKKTKITTIEGLAIAVQEGFEAVHARFDHVEKRFDNLGARLEEAEKRIAALEMKVSGLYRPIDDQKMERLDISHLFARLSKLEEKVFGK